MSNIIKLDLSNTSNLIDTPSAYTSSIISMNLVDGGKGASRGRSLKKTKSSIKRKTPSPLRSKSSQLKTDESNESITSKLKNMVNIDTVKEITKKLYDETDTNKISLFENNLRKELKENPIYISIIGKILTEYALK